MTDNGQRALAETVFQREQTGERASGDALKLEEARETAVENMLRLRALRLAQNVKSRARQKQSGATQNA